MRVKRERLPGLKSESEDDSVDFVDVPEADGFGSEAVLLARDEEQLL